MKRDHDFEAMVDEALARNAAGASGDWLRSIRLAHGGDALERLREHGHELDDVEHWKLLGEKHREAGELHLAQFADLYLSQRPGREHMMAEGDRAALGKMPETFVAWRGGRCAVDDLRRGFSWTTDRSVAVWYATDYREGIGPGPPCLLRATCRRSDVLAYFSQRQESEILVCPDGLVDIEEEPME